MTRRESIKSRVRIGGITRAWSNLTVGYGSSPTGKPLTVLKFPSLEVTATLTPEATRVLADRLHDMADVQEDLLRRDSAHMHREREGAQRNTHVVDSLENNHHPRKDNGNDE